MRLFFTSTLGRTVAGSFALSLRVDEATAGAGAVAGGVAAAGAAVAAVGFVLAGMAADFVGTAFFASALRASSAMRAFSTFFMLVFGASDSSAAYAANGKLAARTARQRARGEFMGVKVGLGESQSRLSLGGLTSRRQSVTLVGSWERGRPRPHRVEKRTGTSALPG